MKDTLLYIIPILFLTCNNREHEKYLEKIETAKEEVVHFDNPAIIMGSSFAELLQIQYKIGKYEDMLKYTSSSTRLKFSNDELLEFYKHMQFSCPLRLKAIKKENEIQTLFYETNIDATQKTIQICVVVEKDTCRILLDTLNVKTPFVGI